MGLGYVGLPLAIHEMRCPRHAYNPVKFGKRKCVSTLQAERTDSSALTEALTVASARLSYTPPIDLDILLQSPKNSL